jgi:Uncharacterized conserved protein
VRELLSNDPSGYAWGVLHERTPRIIAQTRDTYPYDPGRRRALDALLTEITTDVARPLASAAHDAAQWNEWGVDYFGRPWADLPFLWWESYFYRRLLGAVGFFTPGPWFGLDPFEPLKTAELGDPALGTDLAALDESVRSPIAERGRSALLASLWGNRADLGFRVGQSPGNWQQGELVVADDSAELWAALAGDTSRPVHFVADNAGRELLSDLVLIDHLLSTGLVATLTLHLKPRPYYISDATTADVMAGLRRLAAAGGESGRISLRLRDELVDGRLALYTHPFYCAPWSYHHMPEDLADEFESASITIIKGDLNYRRLVGDLSWPPGTPFQEASAYFPGPVAALRTLKSDVLTGITPDHLELLDRGGTSWRTDGTHAVIQVRA